MSSTIESSIIPNQIETAAPASPSSERAAPPTRLLQILKALELEAASDVRDILRRSRASLR